MSRLRSYLRYLYRARSKHGVHSPFVFDFATKVLPHRTTNAGDRIAALRQHCLQSKERIAIEDFGAGYGGVQQPLIEKELSAVARSSARGRREGELLLRMCAHYQPTQLLELGTNLGFSALYMLSGASPRQTLITIEGSEKLSQIATRHFDQFGFAPRQIHADFQAAMETEIDWPSFHPNFVLLDGNHRYAPTVQYFEFLLQKVAKGAIIVLDDIYWSTEMTAAWQQIIAHPRVSVSVDLYALGICFLDRPQAKEHFTLRFRAW